VQPQVTVGAKECQETGHSRCGSQARGAFASALGHGRHLPALVLYGISNDGLVAILPKARHRAPRAGIVISFGRNADQDQAGIVIGITQEG